MLADSDMIGRARLPRRASCLPWGRPGSARSPACIAGVALPNVWSRLAAQWIDQHFLPNVLVGLALGLAKPCFGSTIALRRETLGPDRRFRGLQGRSGGRLCGRRRGSEAGPHGCGAEGSRPRSPLRGRVAGGGAASGASLGPHHPVGGSGRLRGFARHPSGSAGHDRGVLGAFRGSRAGRCSAVAVASRLLLWLLIGRFIRMRPKGLILGPVRDYAAFLVFVLSFWPGSIDWRGHRFALRPDGTLASPDTAGS